MSDEQEIESHDEQDELMMTPKGHLISLLHRRFGVPMFDGGEVWDVFCDLMAHEGRRTWPDCDSVAVVMHRAGQLIPLHRVDDPEIEDPVE